LSGLNKSTQESVNLTVEWFIREIHYCTDKELVLQYALMSAGMNVEEFRQLLRDSKFESSIIYRDH